MLTHQGLDPLSLLPASLAIHRLCVCQCCCRVSMPLESEVLNRVLTWLYAVFLVTNRSLKHKKHTKLW